MSEENPNSITITLRDNGTFDLYNVRVGAISTVSAVKLDEALWTILGQLRTDLQWQKIPEILRQIRAL
jgi:hypothetical protein